MPFETVSGSLSEQAEAWISALGTALSRGDEAALAGLFREDSYWRNLSGISWPIRTYSGRNVVVRELCRRAGEAQASGFVLDPNLLAPRQNKIAGEDVVEAVFRFDSKNGPGLGVVRLRGADTEPDLKAWTFATILDIDRICRARSQAERSQPAARDFAEPSWPDQRLADSAYVDRDPEVLVVGGGHAGLNAAVELKRLGRDVLVIDREKRIGDNWRLRYEGLKLHNKTPVNHLRYMPFPVTMPEYLSKDKVANWLESYVDAMDINFWTEATFEGGDYDEETRSWTVRIGSPDGRVRQLRPKHIVLATSVSGTPSIPTIPTLEQFEGPILHSSEFTGGSPWQGRPVVVIGTGTSAHDICQELHAHGAKVTMVQRSPTLIVNLESAQLYDSIYIDEDGPPLEVKDLLNLSMPYPVVRVAHKQITRKVKELDAPLLDGLEAVGFTLDFGEDETGWPLKFRNRGGGYYFNVGCSELIADGAIGLVQAADIREFNRDGLRMSDGTVIAADLVVLATGFKTQEHLVRTLFDDAVASRLGKVWGLDPQYHELRNMWTRTGQPGLWLTGGAFSMCRIYSRCLALQIDAIEDGRLEK